MMKVVTFGDKLKNPEKIEQLCKKVEKFDGLCICSDKRAKPNGVWRKEHTINGNGTWFYKFSYGHNGVEIWKKVGESDTVVLEKPSVGQKPKSFKSCKKHLMEYGKEEMLSDGIQLTKKGTVEFFISEKHHPTAFMEKLSELVEGGMNVEEARNKINETPVYMEIYYEKGKGLFMVECESIEKGIEIHSPYTCEKYY